MSLLNLVLFLSSFALFSLNSFAGSYSAHLTSHSYKQFSEKPSVLADSANQQLSEKNETETEDGFELEALALPFFFSCIQTKTLPSSYGPSISNAECQTNPIYIAVRNFRI